MKVLKLLLSLVVAGVIMTAFITATQTTTNALCYWPNYPTCTSGCDPSWVPCLGVSGTLIGGNYKSHVTSGPAGQGKEDYLQIDEWCDCIYSYYDGMSQQSIQCPNSGDYAGSVRIPNPDSNPCSS